VQYALWIRDLFNGDLKSFKDGQPVLPKIWQRFLNSLPLFVCATLIVWTLSFPTGIHAAVRRGSTYDRSTTFIAYALISVPGFFLSYLVILWVVDAFGVPVIGMHTFGAEHASIWYRIMDNLWHLVVPSLMLAVAGVAILSRYVRSQMLEVIGQDYVRTARAKGLEEDAVIYKHALRNALLPFITMFGLLLPGLVGGSVIIEQIFAWPGMGKLIYDAILGNDFNLALVALLLSTGVTLTGNLLADLFDALRRIPPPAAVAITICGEQNHRLDLAKAIHRALYAEIRRARRPDRPETGRRQHRDDSLGHIGQIPGDPVPSPHPPRPELLPQPRDSAVEFREGKRSGDPILAAKDQRRGVIASAQQVFGEIETRVWKPARAGHLVAVPQHASAPLLARNPDECPQRRPELFGLFDRPAIEGRIVADWNPPFFFDRADERGEVGRFDPLPAGLPDRLHGGFSCGFTRRHRGGRRM